MTGRRSPGLLPRSPAAVLRRGLAYGLLWAVGINASEGLGLPFGPMGSLEQLTALLPVFVGWGLGGVPMGCAVVALEPRLDRAWKLLLLIVASALGMELISQSLWLSLKPFGVMTTTASFVGVDLPSWDTFLYGLWLGLTHGGLFVVACVLMLRAERHRALLAATQIARQRSEALLDEAQLDALRGQLDPAFMLRAMAAIQQRYASDPPAADRLLDQLVEFLRGAMPGLRSGASTLHAELALARAYAQVCAAIGAGSDAGKGKGWQVEVRGPLPEMPFPPMLLLPLMDHFNAAGARLRIAREEAQVAIGIDAVGCGPLPPALLFRVRVALRSTFGDAFSVGAAPAAALLLRAGPPPAAPRTISTRDRGVTP